MTKKKKKMLKKNTFLIGIPILIGSSFLIYHFLNKKSRRNKNENPNSHQIKDDEIIDEKLELQFQNASNYISNNKQLNLSENDQLKFYSLFKQVKKKN